jgi:hypothetical protein
VIRSWSRAAGRLDGRWLKLRVTAAARGATILYAAAQPQWVVVRLRTERIPAGERRMLITERLPGRPPAFGAPRDLQAQGPPLVRLFDAQAHVQPVVINCRWPILGADVVVFLTGARRRLARASASAACSDREPFRLRPSGAQSTAPATCCIATQRQFVERVGASTAPARL